MKVQLSVELTDMQRGVIGLNLAKFTLATREDVREWFEPIVKKELDRLSLDADRIRDSVKSKPEDDDE